MRVLQKPVKAPFNRRQTPAWRLEGSRSPLICFHVGDT
jgi:hypothetical protein